MKQASLVRDKRCTSPWCKDKNLGSCLILRSFSRISSSSPSSQQQQQQYSVSPQVLFDLVSLPSMSSICGAAFQSNQKVAGYSPNTHFRPPIIITQRSAAGKMTQYFSPQWCKQSLLTPCQLTSRNETSMSVPTPCPMTQVRDIRVMVMMMKLAQRSRNNPPLIWF